MDKTNFAGAGKRPPKKPRSAFAAREAQEETQGDDSVIEGKNPVFSAIKAGREIDKIFFSKGSFQSVGHIIAKARESGITTIECDKRKLDSMSQTGAHQGIIALCAAVTYKTVDDMLALAEERGQKPLIILCDGITDAHNLGAIVRSAEVLGAHGVIIPKRRSAGLNGAAAKAAAGALEYLPVAKCSGIPSVIKELKDKGLFIFAADMAGQDIGKTDFNLPCAIIIGGEGDGVSALAKKESDYIVSIPQFGSIPSLNASNAAAIMLYEIARQRMK